ncbi:34781_t:CDS:1, partial [Gigaspora margarita]
SLDQSNTTKNTSLSINKKLKDLIVDQIEGSKINPNIAMSNIGSNNLETTKTNLEILHIENKKKTIM